MTSGRRRRERNDAAGGHQKNRERFGLHADYLNVERAPAPVREPRGPCPHGVGPMKILALVVLCLGAFGGLLPIALYFGDEALSSQDPRGMRRLTLSDWL